MSAPPLYCPSKKVRKSGITRAQCRQSLREFLVNRDGGLKCCYCQMELSYAAKDGEPGFVTIEHVKPKCLGGTNNKKNLKLACKKCNNITHNTTFHINDKTYRLKNKITIDYSEVCELC